jgi:hypothetical protein
MLLIGFGKVRRIVFPVQDTGFATIDRSPQTFVRTIFAARAADF